MLSRIKTKGYKQPHTSSRQILLLNKFKNIQKFGFQSFWNLDFQVEKGL